MRQHVLTAAVALAVGAAGAWFFAPRRVEVRTEYKDRWREVTVKKTTKTRTRTTKKPDGTQITDQTVTRSDTDTKSNGSSTAVSLTTPAPAPRWSASLLGGISVQTLSGWNLQPQPAFGGHVTYRVAGPFTAGVWGLGGKGVAAGGVSLGVVW